MRERGQRKEGRWKKAGRGGEGRNERTVIPIACFYSASLYIHNFCLSVYLLVSAYIYILDFMYLYLCISVSFGLCLNQSVYFSLYVFLYHWIFVLDSCPSLSSLFSSVSLILPLFLYPPSFLHTSWFLRVLCSILYLFFSVILSFILFLPFPSFHLHLFITHYICVAIFWLAIFDSIFCLFFPSCHANSCLTLPFPLLTFLSTYLRLFFFNLVFIYLCFLNFTSSTFPYFFHNSLFSQSSLSPSRLSFLPSFYL